MGRLLFSLMLGSTAAVADPLEMIAQRNDVLAAVISNVVDEAKIGVSISWVVENGMPRDAAALGQMGETVPAESAPDFGIGALRIDRGTIIVTLGGKVHEGLAGKVVALAPCVSGRDIQFACGLSQCRSGYALAPGAPDAAALTTLDSMQMPAHCR